MSDAVAADVDAGGLGEALKSYGRDLLGALRAANLTALASQVAYSLIFALPSILLVFALVTHEVDRRTGFAISDEVRTLIVEAMPAEVEATVTGLVDDALLRAREGPTTISAVVSIAVAFFAAGNGLGELATAFDRAAGIEDHRPGWQKRLIFVGSAVLIAFLLLVAFTLYVFGGDLLGFLAPRLGLPGDWQGGWAQLQAPVIVLLVFLGTTLLYMASCGCYDIRLSAPGALVSTLLWLLVIKGFAFYLGLAPPSTAYGAASSVLVFLVFLYLSSLSLIVGSISAAVIVRRSRLRARLPLAPGLQAVPARQAIQSDLELGGRG
jgi:membrane protein